MTTENSHLIAGYIFNTSIRPLHRRHARHLILIQRTHDNAPRPHTHLVAQVPLPRNTMPQPPFIVSLWEIVARMRTPTLCTRQRRRARLRSIRQQIPQLERLNQIRVPDERGI